MWIFGYGSLVFRPSFDFLEKRRAFVAGWARRYWQGSPDHRGTPERPGRVVTLVRDAGGWCGGLAYRVDSGAYDVIVGALDHRERAGFERVRLALHDAPHEPHERATPFAHALTYVATPDNPHFLGPLDEAAIAAWMRTTHGPSGPNAEYARELDAALRALGIEDAHVTAIASLL